MKKIVDSNEIIVKEYSDKAIYIPTLTLVYHLMYIKLANTTDFNTFFKKMNQGQKTQESNSKNNFDLSDHIKEYVKFMIPVIPHTSQLNFNMEEIKLLKSLKLESKLISQMVNIHEQIVAEIREDPAPYKVIYNIK